jgi:dTDP-4-amino-4,6-dideoxygalactose transaminase
MAVPHIDLTEQHAQLMPQLRDAFVEVVQSGRLILGHYVERFEEQLAAYCRVKHAVGVSSGTDAISAGLMALGVGPGDEVVLSPFTYVHVPECVVRVGATPVFADINPRTFNIDPDNLEGAVTPRTKVIIAVHLFGLPCHMDAIQAIAKPRGIAVLEDADMALGARYHGRPVGGLGDVGTVSFFPTKSLAAVGDAGAVLTNDDALARKVRAIRVHGLEEAFTVRQMGGAFRMDPLQAAILSIKLPLLDGWVDHRRSLAARYKRLLENIAVTTPDSAEDRRHAYNLYTLRVRGGGREPLRHHLDAMGIGNRVYYPRPTHLQPAYAALGVPRGALPHAERAAEEVLSIPMFSELTHGQQDEVVAGIRDYFAAD